MLPPRGTLQAGEKRWQGPHALQQGEVQSPTPGEEQSQAPGHIRCQLKCSFAGKDLGVLAGHQV